MKTKKISALLCCVAMMVSMLTPAMAVEKEETVIDLGDGFYVVETVVQLPATRAGGTVNGQKNAVLYQGSTIIGVATLIGRFDTSGATAKATSGAINGNGQNGWSYDHGTTRCSGNKVYGTAYFTSGGTTKTLSMTLTCSPDGTIS